MPLKMQAFDDDAALLSMQDPVGGPPSFTALSIRRRLFRRTERKPEVSAEEIT